MFVLAGGIDPTRRYFEKNHSLRNITTFNLNRDLSGGRRISVRQSLAIYGRELSTPGYSFSGDQFNSYTDVTYIAPVKTHALVVGFSASHRRFNEKGEPRIFEAR